MMDAADYAKAFRAAANQKMFSGLQPGRTYESEQVAEVRTIAATLHAIADVYDGLASRSNPEPLIPGSQAWYAEQERKSRESTNAYSANSLSQP